MAVERRQEPGLPVGPNPGSIEIELIPETGVEETLDEDGGVMLDFDPSASMQEQTEHGANLAEFLTEQELAEVGADLVSAFDADRMSRAEWEKTYIKGLDLLGLQFEDRTEPWDGACGVFHPMLTEAVVRFQAQTIQEIFPASGPAKAKVEGNPSTERIKQSHRVVGYLNHLSTNEMKEYRRETEKLLFSLPIAGSAFRKVYFDPNLGRPASMFVPAEDFVVSYGASDLGTCERATHVMKKTANEIRKLQHSGFYRDIELPAPTPDITEIQRKYDGLTGDSDDYEFDKRHTMLEMQVDYDLPGFEDTDEFGEPTGIALPYIITLDKSSREIVGIRRNWKEGDELRLKRDHYVDYEYIPGLGFYGFGLVHIIGGLSKSATSLLRQLVDSGTLANLPGGLKTRGLRIKGDDSPIMPGEFRDVDIPGGAIRDNISFLPYKEPSSVLYQLLGDIVQEGRRFASAADVKAADMNAEAPVGTTLAILEREMKVLSAVQARVHAAMGKELVLLSDLVRDFGPEEYPYEIDGEYSLKEDFSDRIDVIPVSDPNAGTMAQRIMQHQAAIQLAQTAPQMYDMPFLHRQMLETLGIQNAEKIVPTDDDILIADPITENMAIMNGKPVKAHLYQDHESHIQTHMSMAQNPQIQELMAQNPNAKAIMAAGAAHITEHLAFAYRKKIEQELGVPLPHPEQPLPEDIELRLSQLVAPAAAQLTGKAQQQKQAEENAEKQKDPIIQMQQKELEIKEEKVKSDAAAKMKGIDADLKKHNDKLGIEHRKLDIQEVGKVADTVTKLIDSQNRADAAADAIDSKEKTEAFRAGMQSVDKVFDQTKGDR